MGVYLQNQIVPVKISSANSKCASVLLERLPSVPALTLGALKIPSEGEALYTGQKKKSPQKDLVAHRIYNEPEGKADQKNLHCIGWYS